MAEIFRKNIFFLIPYLLFLLAGLYIISSFPKAEIHITANQYHSEFFDCFFYYITYLGDGIFTFFLILVMLFVRLRSSFYMAAGTLFALTVVSILKNYIFEDSLRPYSYFKWIHPYGLHLIEGVDYNGFNSFPSGHTMSAFCSFLGLALIINNKLLKFLLFCLALLVGYSRVYLSQHFFVDVVFGSLIGVCFTFLSFYFFQKINLGWMDKSIITVFKKNR